MTTHFRKGPPKVIVWPSNKLDSRTDISAYVLSFSASKQLHNPVGSFSLSLSPAPLTGDTHPARVDGLAKLYTLLLPNTVVSIGFEEEGGIMLGLVDSVRKVGSTAGGKVTLTIEVSGSDFGKVLTRDSVIIAGLTVKDQRSFFDNVAAALGDDHPLLQLLPGVFGPTTWDGVPTFLGQSVADVVDWILNNVGSMVVPLLGEATGGEGRVGDFISTDFSVTTWNDGRIWKDSIHTDNATIWSYLTSVLDADFYEIRLDTHPNGSALPNLELVVRPKPFDEKKLEFADVPDETGLGWNDLTTMIEGEKQHEIGLDAVFSFDLGISDAAALAYYQVTSQHELIGNPEALAEGLRYPLVDTFTAKRFGLQAYEARLALVSADLVKKQAGEYDYSGEVAEDVRAFRNRLFNWHRLSPWFESGSVSVVGRDYYRPGDPVFLPWSVPAVGAGFVPPGLRYYCTGVSWSWSFGGDYQSSLSLERGHNDDLVDYIETFFILPDAPVTNLQHFAES